MGKIQLQTREQKIILDEVKQSDFLKSHFYFTGGTALSAAYLHHRYSDDLDFFSEKQFDNQTIFTLEELKDFFRKKALELGKTRVK